MNVLQALNSIKLHNISSLTEEVIKLKWLPICNLAYIAPMYASQQNSEDDIYSVISPCHTTTVNDGLIVALHSVHVAHNQEECILWCDFKGIKLIQYNRKNRDLFDTILSNYKNKHKNDRQLKEFTTLNEIRM